MVELQAQTTHNQGVYRQYLPQLQREYDFWMAGAETGWDYSSRWFADGNHMATASVKKHILTRAFSQPGFKAFRKMSSSKFVCEEMTMSKDNLNRASGLAFGLLPALLVALGLWWIILQILPVEFLVSLLIRSASISRYFI